MAVSLPSGLGIGLRQGAQTRQGDERLALEEARQQELAAQGQAGLDLRRQRLQSDIQAQKFGQAKNLLESYAQQAIAMKQAGQSADSIFSVMDQIATMGDQAGGGGNLRQLNESMKFQAQQALTPEQEQARKNQLKVLGAQDLARQANVPEERLQSIVEGQLFKSPAARESFEKRYIEKIAANEPTSASEDRAWELSTKSKKSEVVEILKLFLDPTNISDQGSTQSGKTSNDIGFSIGKKK